MSRYDLLLNRKSTTPAPQSESIEFGFEDEILSPKKKYSFYLKPRERVQVSLIFNNPSRLFMATKAHFYGSNKFLCKSTSNRKAICCSSNYPGNKPVLRIATILYIAPISKLERFISPEPIVLPWVFGKTVYNRLKSLHDDLDLSKYDFLIEHEGDIQKNRFSCQYRISPIASQPNTPAPFIESSWKNHPDLDQILGKVQTISENIKSYIALDLEEHRIRDTIREPQVARSPVSIAPRSNNSNIWEPLRPNTSVHEMQDLFAALDDLSETP